MVKKTTETKKKHKENIEVIYIICNLSLFNRKICCLNYLIFTNQLDSVFDSD